MTFPVGPLKPFKSLRKRYISLLDGMVWYGMVSYGMVWYMVWYGMVWYGTDEDLSKPIKSLRKPYIGHLEKKTENRKTQSKNKRKQKKTENP